MTNPSTPTSPPTVLGWGSVYLECAETLANEASTTGTGTTREGQRASAAIFAAGAALECTVHELTFFLADKGDISMAQACSIRALQIDTVDASTIYDAFQQRLLRGLARGGVNATPGVEGAFDALRSAGVRVVLTTGFDTVITAHILNCLGWIDRIDSVVTGDDVAAGRPAPDMILLGMRRMGEEDRNCVAVVGDTVNDIEAGHRAGVRAVVGVLTGAHPRSRLVTAKPTMILPSAADVPGWLGLTAA